MTAASAIPLAAWSATAPAAATPPVLMLSGTVGGPGFSSANRTWVFADIDTDQDHPQTGTPEHRALTPNVFTTGAGAFVLPIPPSAALAKEASMHDGWVNLFIYAMSSNGAMTLQGVPLKQRTDGTFGPTYFDHLSHPLSLSLAGDPKPLEIMHSQPAAPVAPMASMLPLLNQPSSVGVSSCPTQVTGGSYCGECFEGICPGGWCYPGSAFKIQGNIYTTVAELHQDGYNILPEYAWFEYIHQASSELDLGVKLNGGPWEISGVTNFNQEKGTTTGIGGITDQLWGHEIQPMMAYDWMHDSVDCPSGPGEGVRVDSADHISPVSCCSGIRWGIDMSGLDGLYEYQRHLALTPNYMFGFPPNSEQKKTTGTTDRYSAGANVFGFEVGVTSSWGNGMDIDYQFARGGSGGITWQVFWLWGQHYESTFASAAALDAYTWNPPDLIPQPVYDAPSPQTVCYGGDCPL
jgi:hypothetical protein